MKKIKLSVIIPVYNEEKTVKEIVQRVMAVNVPKEIIIVDDYSSDKTREILKELKNNKIKIILQDKNYGKGYAIRTGLNYATGDIVIIQDADREYDPEDYPKLIKPIVEGKTKVVYGTRFPKGCKTPSIFTNKFFLANRVLTWASNLLYNAHITDEPTCYKVFASEVIKNLNLKCERFEFCPEVTAKVRKSGNEILEVPISYHPRNEDEGKKIKWKDGLEAIWTLIKYRFVN